MRIIFLLALVVSSVFTAAETPFQSLTLLNDEESAAVKIMVNHESQLLLTPPNNDFIELAPSIQALFDVCKHNHTMLIFTQDIDSVISSCDTAFSAGSADAAFLVGQSLLSAQWTSPDYTQAIAYLEKSSNRGSRSAKRYLISAYQNPRFPINNPSYAYQLSEELAEYGMKWDVMVFSAMQAKGENKEIAIIGYKKIIELAKEGFQNAYNLATLIKILNGPLQDLEYAQDILNKPYKKEFNEISFTKVMFSIMQNDMFSARDQLSKCYITNQACALTYVRFLSLGIAGNKDLETAVEVLDYILKRSPSEFANDYAWARATATEKPLFNPIAAQKAINNIPEYKKNMPFIIDTMAANYAATGNFSKAIEFQDKALNSLKGKGLGRVYNDMLTRLQLYKESKRWYSLNNADTFLKKIRNLNNLNHLDAEIASL